MVMNLVGIKDVLLRIEKSAIDRHKPCSAVVPCWLSTDDIISLILIINSNLR